MIYILFSSGKSSTPEEIAAYLSEQLDIPSTHSQAFIFNLLSYCFVVNKVHPLDIYIDRAIYHYNDLEKLVQPICLCKKIYRHIMVYSNIMSFRLTLSLIQTLKQHSRLINLAELMALVKVHLVHQNLPTFQNLFQFRTLLVLLFEREPC